MLLDEAEEPMDFSRGSERLQEYTGRMEAGSGHPEEKLGDPFAAAANQKLGDPNARGLDLSVLDRLSQKVIRFVNFYLKVHKNLICHCEFLQSCLAKTLLLIQQGSMATENIGLILLA